jgi:murein DD-endopeptidase MepM/ murein hydrolase activator NlpD
MFSLGFAAGMAVLALVLWGTGHLTASKQEVAIAATTTAPILPPVAPTVAPPIVPPTVLPIVPTVVPPVPDLAPPPSAVGEANRVAGPTRLAMPIANIDPHKLASNFSEARGGHVHEALDIMAPRGTPVMAVAEGNVVKLFTSKQGGLTVYQFDDSRNWCYYYAHLDGYATGLKEGMLLRRGEVLGYVGSTGDASPSAPHLHFAVFQLGPEKHWWQGTAIDPLPLFK